MKILMKKLTPQQIKGFWLGLDDTYFDVLHAIYKQSKNKIDPFIVVEMDDEKEMMSLNIPNGILKIASKLGLSVSDTISKVLADFVIRWNMSDSIADKGFIKKIKDCNFLENSVKIKLLKLLIEKES